LTTYKAQKLWKWSIYHTKAVIIYKSDAEIKYGKIPDVKGGIGHINTKKIKQ